MLKKPPPKRTGKTAKNKKSKSGDPIAKRNMFCAECLPPEPTADTGPTSGDSVPATSLPLRLVATNVSTLQGESFATILNTSTDRKGAYWMEHGIPDAGQIVRIRGKYVDFRNATTRRVERISLLAKNAPKPAAKPATKRSGKKNSKKDELMAAIDEGVKKVDDTNWEIDRALVVGMGYRGKRSKDRGRLGTGIGLTDSPRVAESHRGTLTLSSKPARASSATPSDRDY